MLRTARRLWVWLVFFCLGLALTVYCVLCSRAPLVSETNLQRIKVGMTRAEVEAVLGEPPAVPTDCQFPVEVLPYIRPTNGILIRNSAAETAFYCKKRLLSRLPDVLVVSYDDDGKVDNSGIVLGDKTSLWERLCDRVAELRASHGW
jgi:hypothetical protein